MSTISVEFRDLPIEELVSVRAGDGQRLPMTIKVNDTALSLTDVTWALTISDERGGTALVSGSLITDWASSGVYVDDASAGQFTIWVDEDHTGTTLGRGSYYWEVTATFPGDHATYPSLVRTLVAGVFMIT